jgi:hypothetical protein
MCGRQVCWTGNRHEQDFDPAKDRISLPGGAHCKGSRNSSGQATDKQLKFLHCSMRPAAAGRHVERVNIAGVVNSNSGTCYRTNCDN